MKRNTWILILSTVLVTGTFIAPRTHADTLPPLKYVALLTQSNSDAPIAIVRENTLNGTVVWGYEDIGAYTVTLSEAFPEGRTFVFVGSSWIPYNCNFATFRSRWVDSSTIELVAYGVTPTDVPTADGLLSKTEIMILVYPE